MTDLIANTSLLAVQTYKADYALRRAADSDEMRRKKTPNAFADTEPQRLSDRGVQRSLDREDVIDLSPQARAAGETGVDRARTNFESAAAATGAAAAGGGTGEAGASAAGLREAPVRPVYVPPGSTLDLTV